MRIFLTLLLLMFAALSHAQEAPASLPFRLGVGGELITAGFTSLDTRVNHGIKLRADLPLSRRFRLVPSFALFGHEPIFKEYAADVDFHYLFNLKGRFKPYPLLGINLTRYWSHRDWMEKPQKGLSNGLNYGLGGEYALNNVFTSYLEIKRAPYFGHVQFSLGLLFSF